MGAMAEASLPINWRTLGRVLYKDWSRLIDSVEFGLSLRKASYSDTFAEYYSQCVVSVILARTQQHDDRWIELAMNQLRISRPTLEHYLAHGDSMLLANCIFISRGTFEAYDKHGWHCDVYSQSKTLQLVSQLDVQDTLPELQHGLCVMWNEFVQNTGNRRSRNLSIYILKHIRNLHFNLHQGTSASPIVFTSSISDRDSVLLFPQSYPSCTIVDHYRATKDSNVYSPPIPVAPPTYTPRIIVRGESYPQSVLSPPDTVGVTRGGARTHAISFSTNITPHLAYVSVAISPSYLLRDHRTEMAPSPSGVTACTTAQGAHVPSPSSFIGLHHGVVLESSAALSKYDASLIPTSCVSHVDVSVQSVDHEVYISQQCISVSPPARAVLRGSPVKDDGHSTGPLADITRRTTGTSATCTVRAIPGVSSAVSTVTFPQSLPATSSSICCFSSAESGDLQNFPAHPVIATPSQTFPIPVMGHAVLIHSQSLPTSSMSRSSDDIPPGTRSLSSNYSTTAHPTTSPNIAARVFSASISR